MRCSTLTLARADLPPPGRQAPDQRKLPLGLTRQRVALVHEHLDGGSKLPQPYQLVAHVLPVQSERREEDGCFLAEGLTEVANNPE